MSRAPRAARAAVALTVTALALAGCTAVVDGSGRSGSAGPSGPSSGFPSGATPPTVASIDFGSCDSVINVDAVPTPDGVTISCGQLSVPLDYSKPTGKKITIEVFRARLDGSKQQPLLLNPGGPGGSGIELAANLMSTLKGTLMKTYDLIGFDPRGVGLSTPIKCISDAEKDSINDTNNNVLTAAGFAAAKAQAETVAEACKSRYGDDLPFTNTVNTAKDMDQLRASLGAPKLDYLGFSYGTELGAQYAHLFPSRVGRLVLDGAVNPLTDGTTSFANQLQGFESSFNDFAAWCATNSGCKILGNPRTLVYSIASKADKTPLRSKKPDEKRTASGNIVLTGVLEALYSRSTWSTLSTALQEAKAGDAEGLFELADSYNQRYSDGTYSNIADSNTTIGCNDSKPGPTDAEIKSTATVWSKKYPMFGVWAAQSLFTCQVWQPVRTVPPLPTAPDAANTILVVGNLNDPATPYAGAQALTATLKKALLLSWDGEGHTSYLEGSDCVDSAVNDYLLDGTLPPANKTCPK